MTTTTTTSATTTTAMTMTTTTTTATSATTTPTSTTQLNLFRLNRAQEKNNSTVSIFVSVSLSTKIRRGEIKWEGRFHSGKMTFPLFPAFFVPVEKKQVLSRFRFRNHFRRKTRLSVARRLSTDSKKTFPFFHPPDPHCSSLLESKVTSHPPVKSR